MTITHEQLLKENAILGSRLKEMEEALDAIRNGEVDAIMVSGEKGDQVYAVSSADTPYRTFIEEMSEGAVTLAKDGTILYCNQRFATIVKAPYEKVIGSSIKQFITPVDNSKLEIFLLQLSHEEHDVIIVSLTNTTYLRLSIYVLPAYLQGEHYILIATDISDLKKKEIELIELIEKLVTHINVLRQLRVDNISKSLDMEGMKNKFEKANKTLNKEITKLNLLIDNLKENQAASDN